MKKKNNMITRFFSFFKESLREYDNTVAYCVSHNILPVLQSPYDYRTAF